MWATYKMISTTPSWPYGHDTPPSKGGETIDLHTISLSSLFKEEYPDQRSGGGGWLLSQLL